MMNTIRFTCSMCRTLFLVTALWFTVGTAAAQTLSTNFASPAYGGEVGHQECIDTSYWVWNDEFPNGGFWVWDQWCEWIHEYYWYVDIVQVYGTTSGCPIQLVVTYSNNSQETVSLTGNGGTVTWGHWHGDWEPAITGASATQNCPCDGGTPKLQDATHSSRVGQGLRMVGGSRTANLFAENVLCVNWTPNWTGDGVSGSGPNATWSGSSSKSVVYHATPSTDYTLNIDIVDPEEHTYGASADDVWVQQYKSAINGAFNTLTGKTTDFNVSGSVSWTRKKIDGGTAESIADYLGMSGTMSIAVGGFSVSTPSIPIASGITVKGKTGMNGITFSLTGTGAYEGSSSTLSLTGSASTSLSVTMEADAAYVLEISVSGSSTVGLSLSGPGSNPIHEIKATGSITANSLVGKFDVKINTGLGWSVDVYHAEHQFGTSVSVPLDYTILSY